MTIIERARNRIRYGTGQDRGYRRIRAPIFQFSNIITTPLRAFRVLPPETYAIVVSELPTVGFLQGPVSWRQIGASLIYTNLRDAERAVDLICDDFRSCNSMIAARQRGTPFPSASCVNRGPVSFPRVLGNRTIARLFGSTNNFQTSRVIEECDVPDWSQF